MAVRPHPQVLSLSRKELLILELLASHDSMYGLQLVTASNGRLKRGTVYVTLGRMEKRGYVSSSLDVSQQPTGGLPRRRYIPTPLGRRMLRIWTSGATQLMPEFAG